MANKAMNSKEILRRIEEIKARAAKATPGPWRADGQFVRPVHDSPQYVECGHLEKSWTEETFANAQFVAHARQDIPWLCRLVRKLLTVAEAAEKLRHHLGKERTVIIEMDVLIPLARALMALNEER